MSPQRVLWAVRIGRAEELLYAARRIFLPAGGSERGAAVRHKQSVLRHARWEVARLTAKRPPPAATAGEIERARFLLGQIDAEEPELLDVLRRRAREADDANG